MENIISLELLKYQKVCGNQTNVTFKTKNRKIKYL